MAKSVTSISLREKILQSATDEQRKILEEYPQNLFWTENWDVAPRDISEQCWTEYCGTSYQARYEMLKLATTSKALIDGKWESYYDKVSAKVAKRAKALPSGNVESFLKENETTEPFLTMFFLTDPDQLKTDKTVDTNSKEFRAVFSSIVKVHGLFNPVTSDIDMKTVNGKNRTRAVQDAESFEAILTEDDYKRLYNAVMLPIGIIPISLEDITNVEAVGICRIYNSKAVSQKEERSALALRIREAYASGKPQEEIASLFTVSTFLVSEYINIKAEIPLIAHMLSKKPYKGFELDKKPIKITVLTELSKFLNKLGYSKTNILPEKMELQLLNLYTDKPTDIFCQKTGRNKRLSSVSEFIDSFVDLFGEEGFDPDKLKKVAENQVHKESIKSRIDSYNWLYEQRETLVSLFGKPKSVEVDIEIQSILEDYCKRRFQLGEFGVTEKKANFFESFKKASK